jgi:hypothetical protein
MWERTFVDCLEKHAVAHPRIDEALAIKQQNLPKRIYKYRQICPNHLKSLDNNTVWLSSPERYNDPYDCWLTLPDGFAAALIAARVFDELVKVYDLQNVLPPDQIENAKKSHEPLKAIIALLPESISSAKVGNPKELAESYSTRLKDWAENLVVSRVREWRGMMELCSFSEVNDSLLMWSHYADQHKGFCVEYDLEILSEDHPFRKDLYPVVYSKRLYDLTPYVEQLVMEDRQNLNHFYPHLCVLHKFLGWEYEKEWRVVKVKDAKTAGRALPAPTPSRIFLGSRFDASAGRELLGAWEKKNIAIYRTRLADDRFELLPGQFVG